MRHIPAHRSFPILKALRLHQAGKFFGFGAVGYNNVINIITIRSVGKREEDIESEIDRILSSNICFFGNYLRCGTCTNRHILHP
jgi:hypothetical protein